MSFLTSQKHDFHTSRVKLLFCSSQSSCSPLRALTAVIPHGRGRTFNPTGELPCGRCQKSGFKGTKMAIPCEREREVKKHTPLFRVRCAGLVFKTLFFSCVFDMLKTRFPPLSCKIAVLLLSEVMLALSSTESSDSARQGSKF